jgi:hypothetical protein
MALFGLGRVFYHQARFVGARDAFQRAASLFAEAGYGAEMEEAAAAAAAAERWIGLGWPELPDGHFDPAARSRSGSTA